MTEDGYPHVGKLDYVAPTLDPSTGTLTARGILENADRALLPGMFLRIRMPLALEKANALLVPDDGAGRRPERHAICWSWTRTTSCSSGRCRPGSWRASSA